MPVDLSNTWVVVGLIVGIPVLWCVVAVLIQMGCALADAPEMSFKRALLVSGLSLLVCVPVGGLIYFGFDKLQEDKSVTFGPMRLLGGGVVLLSVWILSAVVITMTRAASKLKAVWAAGFEILLGALLSALVAGVVLVVMAFVQATKKGTPPPKVWHVPPAADSVRQA
jgi:hypothetical protein